jgi:predicted nucleic acid-binding protein
VTRPIAEQAGLLKRDFNKKGKTLNLGDVIIAATALHNRLTLLTDNAKDFPMEGLFLHSLPN